MSGMTRNYQAEQKGLRQQTERRKEGHDMKREDVTKIFEGATDEQINALLDINSADIGKAKADYNEKLEEIKALNKTISDRDNQLKTLKESAGDNEALKQQITQLQTENNTAKESFQKELDKLKFDSALELKLASSGAKNPKALKGLLDMDKIHYEDGSLTGFAEQLETIKKENDYLFGTAPTSTGMPHGNTQPDYSKMSDDEYYRAMMPKKD